MVCRWEHCTLMPPFFGVRSDATAAGDTTDFSLNRQACFRRKEWIVPTARQLPNGMMIRTPTYGLLPCHMSRSSFTRGLLFGDSPEEVARVRRRLP